MKALRKGNLSNNKQFKKNSYEKRYFYRIIGGDFLPALLFGRNRPSNRNK
jgi:hypothetical protein